MMNITRKELLDIHKEINNILTENSLSKTSFIKRTVFELLEKSGSLLFHNFSNETLWGAYFCKEGRNFFIINSSIELEKQIFAAAHELAHSLDIAKIESEVLTVESITRYPYENGDADKIKRSDLIANRFAAEFLVHDSLLEKEIGGLPNFLSLEETSVFLSHRFLVPYRTIVRRLKEIGYIKPNEFERVYKFPQETISLVEDIYGVCSENHIKQPINRYSNYTTKVINHYRNDLSTYDELRRRLVHVKKTPEQFGIFPDEDLTELFMNMDFDEPGSD